MRRIIIVFAIFLVIGCTPAPTNSPVPPTPTSNPIPPTLLSSSGIPIKAIYFVQGVGQLSPEDLQAHPEVIATDSFNEFKKFAESKVALWVDINSVGLVDLAWLGESPQSFYPVAVVGNSNDFCAFFVNMLYFTFEVPPAEDEDYCSTPWPGFSVNKLTSESRGTSHGYEQPPTVQGILDVTTPLLESVK
jgi:hypothetical protein